MLLTSLKIDLLNKQGSIPIVTAKKFCKKVHSNLVSAGLKTKPLQSETGPAASEKDSTTESPLEKRAAQAASQQTDPTHEDFIGVPEDATDMNDDDASTTVSNAPSQTNTSDVGQISAAVQAARSQEILRVKARPMGVAAAAGMLNVAPPVEHALFSYQDLFASRPVNVRASLPVQYGLNRSIARLNYEFSTPSGPNAQFAVAAANRLSFRPAAVKKPNRMGIVGNVPVGEPVPVPAARHILIGQFDS